MERRRTDSSEAIAMGTVAHTTPSLPTLDWSTFSGNKTSVTPCLLEQTDVRFTTSGRASILLALEILDVGSGDAVLVPSYHCPTMVAPIVQRGAKPVFYPLDASGAPQLEWLTHANSSHVRALLVAHFFGLPQPLAKIRAWCDQHDVRLIEDCAHALFGTSDGRPVGTWGDLAIASLTKFFPVPEGGCLINHLTDKSVPTLLTPSLINQAKAAFDIFHTSANHNRLNAVGAMIRVFYGALRALKLMTSGAAPAAKETSTPDEFSIDMTVARHNLTYASRWMATHAARERIVARRRQHYTFFAQAFAGQRGLQPLARDLPDHSAPYVFPLWVDKPDPGYAELRRLSFPVSRWDQLWPTVPTNVGDKGIEWSNHILQLACHQDLTHAEMLQMVQTINRIYASPPA